MLSVGKYVEMIACGPVNTSSSDRFVSPANTS